MAKVKYRVREYTPTANQGDGDDDNTQTGGNQGGNNNPPSGELEG